MKVGIVGAGAIGTWIAATVAEASNEVSVLARGKNVVAIRENGVRVDFADRNIQANVTVSDDAAELGPQDIVIFAVKGLSLMSAAQSAQGMIGPETLIIPAMNGVPWWFLENAPEPFSGKPLLSVDSADSIPTLLPSEQVIGCVVHASCYMIAPGHVRHVMGDGIILGEVVSSGKSRVDEIAAMLSGAGFSAKVSDNIRQDIWYKLWGNMTMNPISALTGATCDIILDDPESQSFATMIMNEAAQIGGACGCPIEQSAEDRHAVTRKLGAFKTSMLQDAEAGRPLEYESLLAAPQEIARMAGIATPALDGLLGLIRAHEKARFG